MRVYVVTGVELGWDCVVGVYTDEEVARKEYPDEDSYVIHEETLDRTKIEEYEDDMEEEYVESLEVTDTAYTIRRAREQFEEVISSGKNRVSISANRYLYDVKLLIELLESEGFKITYTGKTGYTMEKQQ
jgi:hypothetical protein